MKRKLCKHKGSMFYEDSIFVLRLIGRFPNSQKVVTSQRGRGMKPLPFRDSKYFTLFSSSFLAVLTTF